MELPCCEDDRLRDLFPNKRPKMTEIAIIRKRKEMLIFHEKNYISNKRSR